MAVSEYEVENLFIERLGTIGYQFIQLRDYAEVKKNFKDQLQKFNMPLLSNQREIANCLILNLIVC